MHQNVLSLKEWWSDKLSDKKQDLKLRYLGWDHNTRFLTLLKFDDKSDSIIGRLDSGEKVTYPASSSFWVAYDDGMENEARAV